MTNTHESEILVISALFNLPGWFQRRREEISAGLFQDEHHQRIVSVTIGLTGTGYDPDLSAVSNRITNDPKAPNQQLGALAFEIGTSLTPPASLADKHLYALREAYQRRELAEAHQKASILLRSAPIFASEDDLDIGQQIEDIMASAGKLPGKMLARRHIRELLPEVYSQIEERFNNPGKLAGISTGLPTVDKKTAGMLPGQVWVFAGLPGDGKSTIMQNFAEHAAGLGHSVDWYPLEMADTEQAFRLLSSAGGIDNQNLYSGMMSRAEQEALRDATRRLAQARINIVNMDGATAADIINDISRSDSEIVVVDYLQLMEDPGRKGASREEIIASISRRLKRVAKQTGKVILTASQLNDGGKLRESRAIGQDADKVFLINKHPLEGGGQNEFDDTRRLLWNDKNRGGQRHWELPLHFLGHVFQFREIQQDPA